MVRKELFMGEKITKKLSPRYAVPDRELCAACGACEDVCPLGAIAVYQGRFAKVKETLCVGCGKCVRECPASIIKLEVRA